MDIIIMDRLDASKETFHTHKPSTAIISVTDIHAPENTFNRSPWLKAVLRLKFDDVTHDCAWGLAITQEQAMQIKDFVETVKGRVERLIVHCEAGVSRSAGIGAAILYVLNGEDMPIFENGRYLPNMTCYRKVLQAFHVEIDEKDIENKERINRKSWNRWIF